MLQHDTYRYRIHYSTLTRLSLKGANRSKTKPGKLWTHLSGKAFHFPAFLIFPHQFERFTNATRGHTFSGHSTDEDVKLIIMHEVILSSRGPRRLAPSAQGEMCEQSHPTLTDHIVHHLHPKCKHGDDTPRCARWERNVTASSSWLSTRLDAQQETVLNNVWDS